MDSGGGTPESDAFPISAARGGSSIGLPRVACGGGIGEFPRSRTMALRDRIGIDIGRRLRLEEAIQWAAAHDVRYIDDMLARRNDLVELARQAGIS